ncbi:MAG TPA: LptF/LptG family permease [Bdellovibrionota bacterium]|jgi:LPS export ABC transporter permease LptF|nr:LptF/LptG family permease [Bdellovibrionota bacterium]
MTRIDKYLLSQLTRNTVISTVVALVVLLALQALRLSSLIVNQDLDIGLIARMISGLALSFVTIVIPISYVFAQLGVFGRMSAEKEFVAMQSMGHSPFRLLKPCLGFGLLVSAASLWSSLSLSPAGNRMFESSISEAYKRKVASVLRSGTFSEDFLDTVLFVESVNGSTNELDRVFMYDEKGLGDKSVISARKGLWQIDQNSGLGILTLKNGVILSEAPESDSVRRIKFGEYKVNADFSRRDGSAKNSPPSLSFSQLLERINTAQNDPAPRRPESIRALWSELSRRFAVSFACIALMPLCFGFSLSNKRTAKNRAIMTGIVVLFVYWTLYFALNTWYLKASVPLFNRTSIFAWLYLWTPNFIAVALGYIIMRRRSKVLD